MALVSLILFMPLFLPANSAAQKPLTGIKVGVIPITDFLPLYVAEEKGYFREEGIKSKPEPMAGGAVILPALAGGSVDIGISAITSLLDAIEAGFDFLIVANGSYIGPEQALMVRKDSGINRPRDLAGKSCATNTLKSIGWMYIREVVRRDGGDPAKIRWIEIPFHQMASPLLKRQVDCAEIVEPFIAILKKNPDMKYLVNHMDKINPGGILAPYVALRSWVNKHPVLTERFAKAINKAVDYLNARPKEARVLATKYARIKPELADEIGMPIWKKKVTVRDLVKTVDLMLAHGLLDRRLNVEKVIYKTVK